MHMSIRWCFDWAAWMRCLCWQAVWGMYGGIAIAFGNGSTMKCHAPVLVLAPGWSWLLDRIRLDGCGALLVRMWVLHLCQMTVTSCDSKKMSMIKIMMWTQWL